LEAGIFRSNFDWPLAYTQNFPTHKRKAASGSARFGGALLGNNALADRDALGLNGQRSGRGNIVRDYVACSLQ
jgi:hypothetical protein